MEIEKVYYKHYRYFDFEQNHNSVASGDLLPYTKQKTKWQPTCKGGATQCFVVLENGTKIIGKAICSKQDNFVYAIGRKLACDRAMAVLQK